MPSKKPRQKKLKPVLQIRDQGIQSQSDLEEFIREAGEVKAITQQAGWNIIQRDLELYREGLVSKLAYIDPTKPEHQEARILYIAIDKLFSLINDYEANREKAIELLNKIQNPDVSVTLDIDNE